MRTSSYSIAIRHSLFEGEQTNAYLHVDGAPHFCRLVVLTLNDPWVPSSDVEFDNVALIDWLERVDHVYK